MSDVIEKLIEQIFPDFQNTSSLKKAIIKKANLYKKTNRFEMLLKSNETIDIKDIHSFEEYLINRFKFEIVIIKIEYGEEPNVDIIAMLIAKNSKLTIFDEPEAGIDLWSFNNLINVFEKMKSTSENTILAISHQERILNIADEIIILKDGEIVDKSNSSNLKNILSNNSIHCKKI